MNKKQLYEKIMQNVSKEVKKALYEGRVYNELSSDLKRSYINAKYSTNNVGTNLWGDPVDTDTWGESYSTGSYIFGNFKPLDESVGYRLMVGSVKEKQDDGTVIAVLGNGQLAKLNKEAGFRVLSSELLRDLFAYERLAPINRRKK